MVVKCEQVWIEISNYLEGEVDPPLRAAMEEHLRGCPNCKAVLDGARNLVQLYGDDRMIEVPLGFSHRLRRRLEDDMHPTRRSFFGWMVAAAAAVITVGSFEVARSASFGRDNLRSEHAQPGSGVPPDLKVVLTAETKIFHVAGCDFIHDKNHLRTVTAQEAEQQGYVPCVHCLKQYLSELERPTSKTSLG
jgi:anti-sigma factor RsiW